jgi:predicted ATPase
MGDNPVASVEDSAQKEDREKQLLARWKEQETSSGLLEDKIGHSSGGSQRFKKIKKPAPRNISPPTPASVRRSSEEANAQRRAAQEREKPLTRSELKEARTASQRQKLELSSKDDLEEDPPQNSRDKLMEQISLSAYRSEVRLLDFHSLRLHGRDNETQQLRDALDRSFQPGSPSEVILILGGAGVGKTRLVHDALDHYRDRAFCVEGKFDQNDTNVSQPYVAFLEVFRDLNSQILIHPDRDNYVARIRSALGAEACRVTGLIPTLLELVEVHSTDEYDDEVVRDRSSLKQIFRLLREMIRKLCTPERPLIIFLDDLQWGGRESLAMFQNIANDKRFTNLVLVGTYLDEDNIPLSTMIETVGEFKFTSIRLSALDDESVNSMVANLIDTDPNTTKKYTSVVYRKTGGNALYICQYLDRLQELGYLQYSPKIDRWGWDLHKIITQTTGNDDLHQILVYRIKFLPSTAKTVLIRAACLGNKFNVHILTRLLGWDCNVDLETDKMNDERSSVSPIYMAALEKITGEATISTEIPTIARVLAYLGFLKPLNGGIFIFAHDKIHNAALSVTPEGVSKEQIHWQMGHLLRRLLEEADGDQADVLFFHVVEQLNLGSSCIQDDEERLELAALNLKASYKVKQTSAFFPAAGYAKEGLVLLADVENKWEFYQSLTTKLILVMAEMAMCCGQMKDCMSATQEIISKSRTLEEKVPAYYLRIKNLGQVGKFYDAVHEGLEVLKLLGERFPKESNLALVALNLARTKSEGFGKTKYDFCELGLMQDEKAKMIMKVLYIVSFYAIRGNEKSQQFVPLFFFRMFQITSQFGLCKESVVAFAGYGVLVAALLGEFGEGYRFGSLAIDLQSGFGLRHLARGCIMHYGFLHHLKESLSESLEPLMEGFKAGMVCDETADAVNCLSIYCSHYLNSGLQLEPLAAEFQMYLSLMQELERPRIWQISIPYAQLIDNLMGKSQQPSVLSGRVMNLKQLMDQVKKMDNINALRAIYCARLEAAYWFASYDMAYRMIQHLKSLRLGIGQSLTFYHRREVFFSGLTHLALAKIAKNNRQHIWNARECVGKMKTWASRGSPDCELLLFIMQAELYAVVGRKTDVEISQAYQLAVTNAARVGSLQNLALATELAGAYHLAKGHYNTAQGFLEQSFAAYNEWNAYKKASHLEVLYPQLLINSPGEATTD